MSKYVESKIESVLRLSAIEMIGVRAMNAKLKQMLAIIVCVNVLKAFHCKSNQFN